MLPENRSYELYIIKNQKEYTFIVTDSYQKKVLKERDVLEYILNLNKPNILLYTNWNILYQAIKKNLLWYWSRNNWKKLDGNNIYNLDLWKDIYERYKQGCYDVRWINL